MTGTYQIAEIRLRVTSLHEEVHRLCSDYRIDDGAVDIEISTDQADIDFERERSARSIAKSPPDLNPTDGYLETLSAYRKLAELAPAYDTILVHGSCVAADGEGYLFVAKSGTGKSTHTRLWRELLGGHATMVNDDKPLVRVKDDAAVAFGTPWDGKHRLSTNTRVPLKAICILERADANSISRLTACEAYPSLLQQVYRPMEDAGMHKTLELVDRLVSCVSLWRLGCTPEIEAAQIAYDAMSR